MAITYVAAGVVVGSSSTTNIAVPKPSGVAENDILICCVATYAGNQVITTHADWTNIHANVETDPAAADGTGTEVTIARRILTASEPASWSFTLSVSTNVYVAAVMAFRGVLLSSPVRTSGTSTAEDVSTLDSPSLTGVQSTDMVVTFGASRPFSSDATHHVDGPTGSWTSPAEADTGPSASEFSFPAAAAGSYQLNGTTGTFDAITANGLMVTAAAALQEAQSNPNPMGRMWVM